jgi:formylglycine-generating enzyme required for sulfatase activity
MTQDVALRLAELVRERHDGRITVADYRRLRAPLLDRLVSQAPVVDESSLITRPRATMRVAEPVPEAVAADLQSVFAPRPRIAPWMLWAFIAAAILIVGVGAWYPKQGEEGAEIEPVQISSALNAVDPDEAAEPRGAAGSRDAAGSRGASSARAADEPASNPSEALTVVEDAARTARGPKTSACQAVRAGAPAATCEDKLASRAPGPRLVVTDSFAISARAISQTQFKAFSEKTSRPFPRQPWVDDDDAVVNVTWSEANDYVEWLSRETGQRYRLPTEAEWLQAARTLGTRGGFSAGNVREWVQDVWKAEGASVTGMDQRIVRGISYADDTTTLLSARRNRDAAIRDALTGFRVIREIP